MAEDDKKAAEGASPGEEALADEWAAALEEQGDEAGDRSDEWAEAMSEAAGGGSADQGEVLVDDDIERAEFEDFSGHGGVRSRPGSPDLDVILDIPVTISMEVGNTQIAIRNLLQLNQGSVIELDRLAGEPLDVLVNGTLIAHGEVVMVNEKFGIRLTDVISPGERIRKLKE